MVSDLRKVLGHCLKPGKEMGFSLDSQSSHARILRMTAIIDNESDVHPIDVSALMLLFLSLCTILF
jgi:hypothetical protein